MFGRTSIMIAEVGMMRPNIEVMCMVKSLKFQLPYQMVTVLFCYFFQMCLPFVAWAIPTSNFIFLTVFILLVYICHQTDRCSAGFCFLA